MLPVDNFSDHNDYFDVIDDGYITIDEFLEYNKTKKKHPDLKEEVRAMKKER